MSNFDTVIQSYPTNFTVGKQRRPDVLDKDKSAYKKLLKAVQKTVPNWSDHSTTIVPLCIPNLGEGRFTDISKVVSNVSKEGYDPGIYEQPLAVAIPGKLVRQAIKEDKTFVKRWNIKESGFVRLSEYIVDEHGQQQMVCQEWYIQLCDGNHRRVLQAARQQHPEFDSYDELKGTWACRLTKALKCNNVSDVERYFALAHELYVNINVKKIRKPSKSDTLGAEWMSGNEEIRRDVERMMLLGVYVDGGKRKYGDEFGVKTKYSIFKRDCLSNPHFNDDVLQQSIKWVKLDPDWVPGNYCSPSLIGCFGWAQIVASILTNGNGMQSEFESWLATMLSSSTSDELFSRWKELGGNQDNKYSESACFGMLQEFKTKRLKKLAKIKNGHQSLYGSIVLEKVYDDLFVKKQTVHTVDGQHRMLAIEMSEEQE